MNTQEKEVERAFWGGCFVGAVAGVCLCFVFALAGARFGDGERLRDENAALRLQLEQYKQLHVDHAEKSR